jgi:hypothetical protein
MPRKQAASVHAAQKERVEKDQHPHPDGAPAFNERRLALVRQFLGQCRPPAHRDECPSLHDYLCGDAPTSALEILDWCRRQVPAVVHLLPAIQKEYPGLLITLSVPSTQQADQFNFLAQHPDTLFLLDIKAHALTSGYVDLVVDALRMPGLRAIHIEIRTLGGFRTIQGSNNPCWAAMRELAEFATHHPEALNHPLDELKIRTSAGGWFAEIGWGLDILKFLGRTARRLSLENFAICHDPDTQPHIWSSLLDWLRQPTCPVRQLTVGGRSAEWMFFSHAAGHLVQSGSTLPCSIDLVGFEEENVANVFWAIPTLMQLTNGSLIVPGGWCCDAVIGQMHAAYESHRSKMRQLSIVGPLRDASEAGAEWAVRLLVRVNKPMEQRAIRLGWISLHMLAGTDLGDAVRLRTLGRIINVPLDIARKIARYFSLRDLVNIELTSKGNHVLAQLEFAKGFTFNPHRLNLLSDIVPPLARGECPSLYDYFRGRAPASAGSILAWCTDANRNLHHVLPTIQHSYPDLLLQVTMPPVNQKHAERLNYLLALHDPNLRVSLTVYVRKLQDGHVHPLLTLLQQGCIRRLSVVATGNAGEPVTLKAMDAVGDFIGQHPAAVHPVEELRMDFRQHQPIAGTWPMLLLKHFGPTARKVCLNNFAVNTRQGPLRKEGETWDAILTSLNTGHVLTLVVLGRALEASEFLHGVGAACQKGLALSCNIVVKTDRFVNTTAWSPRDLMKLTTGVLTIDGLWCSRRHLLEMLDLTASPHARTQRIRIVGNVPINTPADTPLLAWAAQTPFFAWVVRQAAGRAGLYVMRVRPDMDEDDRTALWHRIAHLPDDLAEKIARYLNFGEMQSVVQASKATHGLLQKQIAKL